MSDSAAAIGIYLNGELREVAAGESLAGLIESLGLPPQAALVEHNGRALLRSEWPAARLADGDRIEVLRVVAGG
jgi:sulfur carrier protein